jgi:hypothetical protein
MPSTRLGTRRTSGIASTVLAVINYNAKTGAVTCEEWWDRDRLDRPGGPAVILRDATGEVTREKWWKNGKQIPRD